MPSSDKPYLNFIIDPVLLKRLDDFRYRRCFPTRPAAVKWLLVEQHGKESAACAQLRLDLLVPLEPVVWLGPD
jgi:hypothetical protein